MLFADDGSAGFGRGLAEGFFIQRFDGVDVDDAGRNSLGFQDLRGANGLGHQQAVGDEGDVVAGNHLDGLADLELLIRGIDDGRLGTSGADEARAGSAAALRTRAFIETSSAGL